MTDIPARVGGTSPSPEGDVPPTASPGAGQWPSIARAARMCCHQHMIAVSPEPQLEYRRTRTK